MKPCPECNGTGKITPGYGDPDQKWTCSECDGTGEIPDDDGKWVEDEYPDDYDDAEDEDE